MIKAKELRKAMQADPQTTLADIQEALDRGRQGKPGGLRPEDFAIQDLAAQLISYQGEPIGESLLRSILLQEVSLLEGDGALSTSMFAAITGQVLKAAIMEGYQLPEFVLSSIVGVIPGHKQQAEIDGVSLSWAQGKNLQVGEGQEYPAVGMGDEYVKTPRLVKRGALIRITKEALLADETGQILEQARRVGELIGLEKEQALTDYVIGAVQGCVIEKRIGDSTEGSYDLFYTSGRYANRQTNALADWTDIDAAEELFTKMTMPGTGQPPILTQRFVLVPPQLRSTAGRILNATETRSGTSNVVVAANPLAGLGLRLVVSPLVYTRLVAAGASQSTAAGTWFYGDLPRAFRYYQSWSLQVEEDMAKTLAFTHDVAVQFKTSERGTPVVGEPRLWSRQDPS